MNLLHMKYAVEIAETSSINKAAEKLYVGQSALSRAIKELESSLGVTLFDRSARGMTLTPDGEVFIRYARTILKQVDAVEEMFSRGDVSRKRFSLSVPRASYIPAGLRRTRRRSCSIARPIPSRRSKTCRRRITGSGSSAFPRTTTAIIVR